MTSGLRGCRRVAPLVLGLLSVPAPAVAATASYPPAEYLQYGSASAPPYTTPGTNPNPSYHCGFYAGAVDATTLSGTGLGSAQISFTTPISYQYSFLIYDGNKIIGENNFIAFYGAVAFLKYTSPDGGTIDFDFVKGATYGSPPALPKTVAFAVDSTGYSDGIYKIDLTIQFPGCPLEIQAIYR